MNYQISCAKIFYVSYEKEITSEMFIQTLDLRTVIIAPKKDNTIDCTLDFSDELLVVRFNDEFEIYDISHES
ncbi:hypothetical protein C3943_05400 [Lysinibacillus sp. B2A1]|nr:hypothetical protein C3943_05400 [Lysinibacillus sp. B2A1]